MSRSQQNLKKNIEEAPRRIHINIAPFNFKEPRLWFTQLEGYFFMQRIENSLEKYCMAISGLPSEVTCEIPDLLQGPPKTDPYEKLKDAILTRMAKSDKARLRELLSGIQMGDRTPSQSLQHMKSLAGPSHHDEPIFRELWQRSLPSDVQTFLAIHPDNTELEKQAEIASKIFECLQHQRLSHISAYCGIHWSHNYTTA